MRTGSAFENATRLMSRWNQRPVLQMPGDSDDVEIVTRRVLVYYVLPLWFVPAVSDWIMHRRTDIEHTSGTRESLVHALMMTEAGVPVVLGLFARINPLVLSIMGGAALVHGATALWDVQIATEDREVRPIEQHIHSFLEVLPLTAMTLVACLHGDQVKAIFTSKDPDKWRLMAKRNRLPKRYVLGLAAAIGAFVALPYGEELLRCLRAEYGRG